MVVDSSVWMEMIFDGPLRKKCEDRVKGMAVLVPSSVLFEVYKKIKKQISEEVALETVAALSKYKTIEITRDIALLAADLSLEQNLGMADSLVLACANANKVGLITLDNDFTSVPNAQVIR
ncbi:MAG: type II toxin-antitoxin system VapC family toxin [Pseudobdellovibrionaceae bacterium]